MSFVNNILSCSTPVYSSQILPKCEDEHTLLVQLCKCDNNIPPSAEFKGTYKYDYNILQIHNTILHNFNNSYSTQITQCANDINSHTLGNNPDTSALEALHVRLEHLQSQVEKTKYLETALPYLLSYRKLKPITISLSQRDSVHNDTDSEFRHELIAKYLDIASTYITINLVRIFDTTNCCKLCAHELGEYYEYVEDLCPHCGAEFNSVFKYNNTSSDIKQPAKCNNDSINFEKAILRFEGRQPNKLPEQLWNTLDKYFISYGLYPASIVRAWEFDNVVDCRWWINARGVRVVMNREIMEEALKKTDHTDYYNDMNLILNLYWAFPLPDISSVIDGVREDFAKTQQAFNEIEKRRTSNMNSDFRLLKHLELRRFPFKRTQFKFIKTPQIRVEYETLWQAMCTKAGLEYIATKW